jgi:hypothetical protein
LTIFRSAASSAGGAPGAPIIPATNVAYIADALMQQYKLHLKANVETSFSLDRFKG